MHTGTQSLRNKLAARCTPLAGVGGVDFNELRPGSFDLVSKHLSELTPTCIVNRFVQSAVTVGGHVLDVEFFNRDQAKLLRQAVRQLVQEVLALTPDLGVKLGQAFALPLGFVLSVSSLDGSQAILSGAIPAWIFNLLSSRERSERL